MSRHSKPTDGSARLPLLDEGPFTQRILAPGDAHLLAAAEAALSDQRVADRLMDGLVAKDDVERSNSFNALLAAIRLAPDDWCRNWVFFANLLRSQNAFHRGIGVKTIVALASADKEHHLDSCLDELLRLIDDPKIMVARYVVQSVPELVEARPDLKARLTDWLMQIGKAHQPESRKELLRADAVDALDRILHHHGERQAAAPFVELALASSSPKAKKAARVFLASTVKQKSG